MTNAQITALTTGLLAFAAIWAVMLFPLMARHRSRYGQVSPARLCSTASVTLYACLGVAVVLLPLPGPNTPRLEQAVQLVPFQWVADIQEELAKHGLSAAHALSTQTFTQMLMNIALFAPLGLFARVLWRRGLLGATALGFGVSLLVEITQLTANFGTAPFAYRIFDVDDLITNTVGASAGWLAGALVLRALHSARPALPAREYAHA
ncbi:VanZ family protein [Kutzneria viridogrisea]|uniref:VanZ-like domain-containing protein n=2 Tax=Kutzneria TaxID=43356 RepID=W5VZS8_9PSEU|nr:VanZ family protein [Kutzneria albida]AHH94005.1 hypothetical protein KALB_630 [Kutzneria albida DSM 43870]MBA8930989.1 glycopeptide antibiotics resistance protein [Kutzneria viridogrisea]